MTNRQRLELRASEIRQELNDLAGVEDPTSEQSEAMDTGVAELRTVETSLRAAIAAEAAEAAGDADTSEGREHRELEQRARLSEYVAAAADDRDVSAGSPEAELRAAEKLTMSGGVAVPWSALAPREVEPEVEARADVATAAPATTGRTQADILGRVFADGAAAFLGVSFRDVPTGVRAYPLLSAGASGAQAAKGTAHDAVAATFTAEDVPPRRLTARYLFSVEDLSTFQGMEDSLRADLRGALREAMDLQAVTGDGTAPNVSGFLTELSAPSTLPTIIASFSDVIGGVAQQVDGRYARNIREARMLVGTATYARAAVQFSSGGDISAADYLLQRSGGINASAHVPAPTSTVQAAIVWKSGRGSGSAVAPVWQGLRLIRDNVSQAASGRVAITAIALWNFKLVQASAYARVALKVA